MIKNEQSSMVIFERAAVMLLEADTIQKARELKDLALTAGEWAKRKGMGEAAIQHCRSYALEAERKMGEMLLETERAVGSDKAGRRRIDGDRALPSNSPPTLRDLGLSKRESSAAQKLAEMPRVDFDEVRSGKKTRTEVKRQARRREAAKTAARLPEGKFRVIYADPPWSYGDSRAALDGTTGASAHYPSMTIGELCALDILEKAADDSVLFLWVTSPLLFECLPVIEAWGFKYKSSFVWDKVKHNLGHYNSVRHEFLLVCTRGSCVPDVPKLFDSVQSIEKSRKHSEKPEEFRRIIETLYPHGKKLELFARKKSAGWEAYGTEC